MPITPMTFRPMTLEEGSPFGGVLSDAIAKRLALANTQKAEKEVPYAGISSFANALSKIMYANAVQPQYALKAAAHPQIWSNMSPAQKASTIELGSGPAGGGMSGSLAPAVQQAMDIFNKQQRNEQPAGNSNLLSGIMRMFGGDQQIEQNSQQPSPPPQQQNGYQNAQPAAPHGLPVVSPNLGEQDQASQNEANYKSGQAAASASGTALGNQSADQLKIVQQNSQNALQMDNLIDSALAKSKDVIFKGPGLGKLAKFGPDSAQLLKDTNAMAVQLAGQLYGANTTNAKDATATTLKLNIEDPEKAFEQYAEKMKAMNDRVKWQGTFYDTMSSPQINITNPQQRDQIWFDYNAKYPPYDYKKHEPIYENLGLDQQKFVKFITQDKANNNSLNKRIDSTLVKSNFGPKAPQSAYDSSRTGVVKVPGKINSKWSHLGNEDLEAIANG